MVEPTTINLIRSAFNEPQPHQDRNSYRNRIPRVLGTETQSTTTPIIPIRTPLDRNSDTYRSRNRNLYIDKDKPVTPLPFKKLVKEIQFYWFLGNASQICFFTIYSISPLIGMDCSLIFYQSTLVSILFTYFVVLRQTYHLNSTMQLITTYKSLLRDDNVQYFLLAILLYSSSKKFGIIQGSLYSFNIFSLIHVLNYSRKYIIPILPVPSNIKTSVIERIVKFEKSYYEIGLYIASNSEILLIFQFFFNLPKILYNCISNPIDGIRLFLSNLVMLSVIIIFLKLRFDQSKYTRFVISQFDLKINEFLKKKFIPTKLHTFYNDFVRSFIHKYIEPIKLPAIKNRFSFND